MGTPFLTKSSPNQLETSWTPTVTSHLRKSGGIPVTRKTKGAVYWLYIRGAAAVGCTTMGLRSSSPL